MQPSPDNDPKGQAPIICPQFLPLFSCLLLTPFQPPCCSHSLMLFPPVNTWLTSSLHLLWQSLFYEFTKTHCLFPMGTWLDYISQHPLQLGVNMWLSFDQWIEKMHVSSRLAHKNPQDPFTFYSSSSWIESNLKALKRAKPEGKRNMGPSVTTRKEQLHWNYFIQEIKSWVEKKIR